MTWPCAPPSVAKKNESSYVSGLLLKLLILIIFEVRIAWRIAWSIEVLNAAETSTRKYKSWILILIELWFYTCSKPDFDSYTLELPHWTKSTLMTNVGSRTMSYWGGTLSKSFYIIIAYVDAMGHDRLPILINFKSWDRIHYQPTFLDKSPVFS